MGLPDECRMIFEESQGNGAGRRFTRNDIIGREMIRSEIYLFFVRTDRKKKDFCIRVMLAFAKVCLKDARLFSGG